MKLHSKLEYIGEDKPKGRVGTLIGYSDSHKAIVVEFEDEDGGIITTFYRSLAEFNEEWEDYALREPLIKDEKVCKAVRAWADANGTYPIYWEDGCTVSINHTMRIEFSERVFAYLDVDKAYTIAELCGEE